MFLIKIFSVDKVSAVLREAGNLAGREFCLNALDRELPFGEFAAKLQDKLMKLKVGILRIEKSDLERLPPYISLNQIYVTPESDA